MPATVTSREPLPRFVEPMLLKPGLPDPGDDVVVELKWDGIRGQMRVDGAAGWCLRSRPGRACSDEFPELEALGHALRSHRILIDGEVVCLDAAGRPDFAALRRRLTLRGRAALDAAARSPATFVVFDVLHVDGRDVRRLPYAQRIRIRDEVVGAGTHWRISEPLVGDLDAILDLTRRHLLEGVVCKRLGGVYEPGRRSGSWMKHKHRRTERLAVTGWKPGQVGEPDIFYVARVDADGRRQALGGVQYGLSAEERHRMRREVERRAGAARRATKIRNVEAGVFVDVAYHGAGLTLRDPVLRRLVVGAGE